MKTIRTLFTALMLCLLPSVALAQSAAGGGYFKITPASPTACTSLAAFGPITLDRIENLAAAQSVFVTIYDESGTTPTCAAADVIYGDGTTVTLGAQANIQPGITAHNGLAIKLSAATTGVIIITTKANF